MLVKIQHVDQPQEHFKFELSLTVLSKNNKRHFAEKIMNTRCYLQDYNRCPHSRCVGVPVQTLRPHSE